MPGTARWFQLPMTYTTRTWKSFRGRDCCNDSKVFRASCPVRSHPERRVHVEQLKHAMQDAVRLAELREQRVGSQGKVAHRLQISQARVSQIERSDDWYLSTLQGYVAALGGKL